MLRHVGPSQQQLECSTNLENQQQTQVQVGEQALARQLLSANPHLVEKPTETYELKSVTDWEFPDNPPDDEPMPNLQPVSRPDVVRDIAQMERNYFPEKPSPLMHAESTEQRMYPLYQ